MLPCTTSINSHPERSISSLLQQLYAKADLEIFEGGGVGLQPLVNFYIPFDQER